MNFDKALQEETNVAFTENGGASNLSTLDKCLDLFARCGSMRSAKEQDIIELVDRAYGQNKQLTLLILFYNCDIKEGLGERRFTQIALKYLANKDPNTLTKVASLLPTYNRWDLMYCFVGTQLQKTVFGIMKEQYVSDLDALQKDSEANISLIGKWLKSENTESKISRKLARLTIEEFGVTERQYRKALVTLRKRIKIVEHNLVNKEYASIDYDKIPAKALMKYIKAFYRNDEAKIKAYFDSIERGEKEIKVTGIYPHDILYQATGGVTCGNSYLKPRKSVPNQNYYNELWKNQKDYMKEDDLTMVVADTSASMTSPISINSNVSALDVAMALGIYCSERLKGQYTNKMITFSSRPSYVTLTGEDLLSKLRCVPSIVDNTNLVAVFKLLLDTAKSYNIDEKEFPKKLLIISDMEFDASTETRYGNKRTTVFRDIKNMFDGTGYKMPQIVFWNVNSRNTQFPITVNDEGAVLISGYSPVALKAVYESEIFTPVDVMIKAVTAPRYYQVIEKLK